jgi:hypothetical protein
MRMVSNKKKFGKGAIALELFCPFPILLFRTDCREQSEMPLKADLIRRLGGAKVAAVVSGWRLQCRAMQNTGKLPNFCRTPQKGVALNSQFVLITANVSRHFTICEEGL